MKYLMTCLAGCLLGFPSVVLAQHVPDLSPHAIGLMPQSLIDELLATCRDPSPPDWLNRDECERLSNERDRRLRTQDGTQRGPLKAR
jgi:hypothetical protein